MTAKEKLEALLAIEKTCTAGEIEGQLVDLFSASACLKLAESLNPKNRKKFLALPTGKMISTAFALLA